MPQGSTGGGLPGHDGMACIHLTAAVGEALLASHNRGCPQVGSLAALKKRTHPFLPSAAFLEKAASDETTPRAYVHVCRLAAGKVKREVAVYMVVVHAVARYFKR